MNPRPLKRKRKTVRFDDEPQIVPTYSSEEYDRGGIFSFPVLYKVNPSILQPNPSPPKLSLDTHCYSPSDEKQSPQTPSPISPKQRPKLTINTDLNGPAFLTRLSTIHHDDKHNDYLVPLSAYSPPSFFF